MKKRPLLSALILGVALLLSVLLITACGGDGDGDAVTTEPTTEAPELDPVLAANQMDAMIAAIDGATLENTAMIDDAYLAYWSLPEAARAKVKGYETLQNLRYELTKEYVVKDYKSDRIPHNEILIGGYGCADVSDRALEALVDCHFDFMGGSTAFDQLQKHGLGAWVSVYNFDIPNSTLITEEEFRAYIAGKTYDHEAIWFVDHRDEPGSNDMINLWRTGKIIAEEIFPNSIYLQNMLPNLASGDMMRDPDCTYSWTYANTVGTFNDAFSFDHYPYDPGAGGPGEQNNLVAWLCDLWVQSSQAASVGSDLINIIHHTDAWNYSGDAIRYQLEANQMKFQAYGSLAFGVKSLMWFYMGTYDTFLIDAEGNPTHFYEKFKETNGDVKALEPVYMRYTAKSHVLAYDEKSPLKTTMEPYQGNKDVTAMKQSSLIDIAVGKKNAVLIGAFEKNVEEGEAFMFVGCNNYRFQNNKEQVATVTFKAADPTAVLTAYVKGIPSVLTPDENGVYTVEIVDADAVFVTVD
ncbi:MAG: hypothetical protein IJD10_01035 [Clostridia bacterium]|nr:hypothetical protein [Clostridia bacterium]